MLKQRTVYIIGGIAYSSSYGSEWEMSGKADSVSTNWNAASCDSSGKFFYACSDQGIYRSSDFGASWSKILESKDDHRGISSDSTGQYLATVAYGSSGSIKVSSDYGSTWSTTFKVENGYSLDSDSSGRNIVVGCYPGFVYQSDDYGRSFRVANAVKANWPTVTMTSGGK